MGTAAGSVTGEGSVDVAISEDEIVALEEGHDLAFAAIGKIGSVEKREGGGGEKAFLLAATGGGLHEGRGIPFSEVETIAANFEPAFEEIELGGFAGAVGAFDDDKRTGIGAARDGPTGLRESGLGSFLARSLYHCVLSFHGRAKIS
jgi:hypothetical protein